MRICYFFTIFILTTNVLSAQTDTISSVAAYNQLSASTNNNYTNDYSIPSDLNNNLQSTFIKMHEVSVLSKKDTIPSPASFAKKTIYSINYTPLYGFWKGLWPISANFSVAKSFLEWSTTLSKRFEHSHKTPTTLDISQSVFAVHSLAGPRYVIPSKSSIHLFVHGLIGVVYLNESLSKDYGPFLPPYNESHFGISFSPGLGAFFKRPSKLGFRLGLDFIFDPGYSDKWAYPNAFAFQFTGGIVLGDKFDK